MDKCFKEIQELYESIYNQLPPDEQDKYYDFLLNEITPFLEKVDNISKQIYELSEDLKFLDDSQLKSVFENYVKDSKTEFKKYNMFFGNKITELRDVAESLSYEDNKHNIMNILTGRQ